MEGSELAEHLKKQAKGRLDLAESFIDDTARLQDLVRPGRMIIVDVRSDDIEKSDALGLFVVLMQLFAEARHGDEQFNELRSSSSRHTSTRTAGTWSRGWSPACGECDKGMSVVVASRTPRPYPPR